MQQSQTSIVTQLQKMRNEQFEIAMENKNFAAKINENLTNSRELIARKFEEFTTLLQKSNTEALVKAIENVIGGFNERLNQLLERLVKENFEELNNSVKQLNEWQKENKEQVRVLVLQFKYIYERLQGTSETLKQITATTDQLTGNSSLLKKLVEELQQVMVEDQIFKESVQKLQQSSTELHSSSEKLDSWIKRETTFAASVDNLISSLKEIEQLRDSSGQFWNDIKSKLNENSDILAEGNQKLMNQVNNLEKSFQERMNTSFRSLDKILQAMVTEYAKKMNTNYQAS